MTDSKRYDNRQNHGIDKDNLDISMKPGVDFYRFSCGGWMDKHPIPPEFSNFNTFTLLRENARRQLKDLILNLNENPETKVKGTSAQKVCDIYNLGMDIERRNREGASPVMPMIEKINSFRKNDFEKIIAWVHNGISGSFFSSGAGPDPENSDLNILHIGETGLGLGDRDYYLERNENNDKIMEAYEIYVKRLMELIGYDESAQKRVWENVISIETEFARHKKTREERRDPLGRYNPTTMDCLCEKFPNIDWKTYFAELNISHPSKINLSSPKFLKFINGYIPGLEEQQIKDYLVFDVVSESSNLLSEDFMNANFELYDRTMSGKEQMEPLWKRAMTIPNSMLGDAVGELYVEKYFPSENKDYMLRLVENLRKSLARHIKQLTWMSEATQSKALEKLSTMKIKIGYPDKWKDYSEIDIEPSDSYLANVHKAAVWYTQENYQKIDKPVDKEEWMMTPQTVNAYYMPSANEVCFPAGILQPPYFDPKADDAQNYGAIGVVIGHEMTHGFDDQGRKFDKNGNLTDWWLPEDADKFNSLTAILEKQFNEIEVAPGVHANGKYTLGENIADQGGLRIAMSAYRDSIGNDKSIDIDGFTPIQRFYIAYANVWAGNIRHEEILQRTKTDPHSLGRLRVNATLRNISDFFEAFDIKDGDPMFRDENERVIIW